MKYFLLLGLVFCCSLTFAQPKTKDNILSKTACLNKLLHRADTLRSFDNWETIEALNDSIASLATDLLSSPSIVKYNLDSLLPGIVHSKDKRLWIFSWFENTGGSFQSHLSILHYRTASGKPKATFLGVNDVSTTGFCTGGGTVDGIHKLPHPTKNIYLCLSSVRGCGSCCAQAASIIELIKSGINLTYPAFKKIQQIKSKNSVSYSTCYMLDSRCGSIEKFDFNAKASTISYEYKADDNAPISQEEASAVKGELRWNGKAFIEVILKKWTWR